MIDYDKFKLAHELINKLPKHFIKIILGDTYTGRDEFMLMRHNYDDEEFDTIDELVIRLQELTLPNPKYEIGENVWFIDYSNNKFEPNLEIKSIEIKSIDFHSDSIRYVFFDDYCYEIKEDDVYPSREALIQAQIEYWSDLATEESFKQTVECKKCRGNT